MRFKKLYAHFSLLLSLSFAPILTSANELPDLGDTADSHFSPYTAQLIGKQVVNRLIQANQLQEDWWVPDYVQTLGRRLTASLPKDNKNKFNFFVLQDDTLNAFALPGGYIGVNAGLIKRVTSENELAAVMAHEIAHVQQNHVARRVEAADNLTIPLVAAALAAMVLATEHAQAGSGALAATLAGNQQMQLDYSRNNEFEADRVGLDILANAGFDPRAMPEVFQMMQRLSFGGNPPEYLSSHPVNTARIADSKNRADFYPKQRSQNSLDFALIQARLDYLEVKDNQQFMEDVEGRLKKSPTDASLKYAQALALYSIHRVSDSQVVTESLLEEYPHNLLFNSLMADIEQARGAPGKGCARLEKMLKFYPSHRPTTLQLSKMYVIHEKPEQAIGVLKPFVQRTPDSEGFRLLAEAYRLKKDAPSLFEAQAEYYLLRGEKELGVKQLQLALNAAQNQIQIKKLKAKIEQIKRESI